MPKVQQLTLLHSGLRQESLLPIPQCWSHLVSPTLSLEKEWWLMGLVVTDKLIWKQTSAGIARLTWNARKRSCHSSIETEVQIQIEVVVRARKFKGWKALIYKSCLREIYPSLQEHCLCKPKSVRENKSLGKNKC